MIPIDLSELEVSDDWRNNAEKLTNELASKPSAKRSEFIDENRDSTWGANELRQALSELVGHKCWYTEVALAGADPHVDHFRPKGAVREVDENLKNTGTSIAGYWWLAFEMENYRLTCQHANARRVDEDSDGGKWDYFPVEGDRAAEKTPTPQITESKLILDPASVADVQLLWFDADGSPSCSQWKRPPNDYDKRRVEATIWIYHLKKEKTKTARGKAMQDIRKDVVNADTQYRLWNRDGRSPNEQAKNEFDKYVATIRKKTRDDQVFAGAKRCMLKNLTVQNSKYAWIEEFVPC